MSQESVMEPFLSFDETNFKTILSELDNLVIRQIGKRN